jgi:hypothetical protein
MKLRMGVPALIALVLAGSLWLLAQVNEFRPVTEAMLRNRTPRAVNAIFVYALPWQLQG